MSSVQGLRQRILVVDDDAAMTRMISMSLRMHGYDVRVACNGADALDQLDGDAADAILLDLQMPVMDGRTFYRRLRESDNQTPVIILSANGAREAYRELAAQGYLPKPFHPDELTTTLSELLSRP